MAKNEAEEIRVESDNMEEDFSTSFDDEVVEEESLHVINKLVDELKTHENIHANVFGKILKLDLNYSKTILKTTSDMALDEFGLVYSGYVFGAADYAAAIAVNETNMIIIGSRISFLAPAKVGDLIEFEAKSKFDDSRKREIRVLGYINEVKVFEGIFHAVILAQHIFKTKIKNINRSYK